MEEGTRQGEAVDEPLAVLCDELRDIGYQLRDLLNELEPGMLVERAWIDERNTLLKEFMSIAQRLPPPGHL